MTSATGRPSSPPAGVRDADDEFYLSPGRTPLDRRGPWLAEFREDLGRYRAHHDDSLVRPLLLEQALWALLQYRMASGVFRSRLPAPVKAPLLLAAVLGHKLAEMVTGISLPYRADLLPGLYIGHFGPLLVNDACRVGAGCNLSQGVSIGVTGRGEHRGAPVIGNRVYIGANAVVVGPVTVGDDAVVGAASLVAQDVRPSTTAVGVPARRAADRGTAGMGMHMRPRPRSQRTPRRAVRWWGRP